MLILFLIKENFIKIFALLSNTNIIVEKNNRKIVNNRKKIC